MTELELDFSPLYGPYGIVAWDKIPQFLREIPNWVLWCIEERDGKEVKVPYTVNHTRAASNDPRTWSTFEQVRQTYKAGGSGSDYAGIGFVFTSELGLIGIDLDDCIERDKDGHEYLSTFAQRVLEQIDSYTELSPSGTGLHIICTASIPRAKKTAYLEIYATGRYFTVTGDRWPGASDSILDCTSSVASLWNDLYGDYDTVTGTGGAAPDSLAGAPDWDAPYHLGGPPPHAISKTKATKLHKRGAAYAGYTDLSEADWDYCYYLALNLGSPTFERIDKKYRESALMRSKWDTKHYSDGTTYGAGTLKKVLDVVTMIGLQQSITSSPASATGRSSHAGQTIDHETGEIIDGPLGEPWSPGETDSTSVVLYIGDSADGALSGAMVVLEDGDGDGDSGDDDVYIDLGSGDSAESSDTGAADPNRDHLEGVPPSSLPRTDTGNAERFAIRQHENVIYVPEQGTWYIWNGFRWKEDAGSGITIFATRTVRDIYREAKDLSPAAARQAHAEWAQKSESIARIRAMEELGKSQPRLRVDINQINQDIWLLNCLNGTIDLRTGQLRDHVKSDFITGVVPAEYDPHVNMDEWLTLIDAWTAHSAELAHFLQCCAGYSGTGSVKEEVLFFLFGGTETGKSTFFIALRKAMASYARVANFETFIQRRPGMSGPRDDLAELAGSRMVVSIEVNEGARLAEGLVKTLTGGDPVKARFLYKSLFEFMPTFKFWLAANHSPEIKSGDAALWRRIYRIPFDTPVIKDRSIKEKANAGYYTPMVLRWIVEGAVMWLAEGLNPPEMVLESTRQYKEETEPLKDFLEQGCVLGPDAKTKSGGLYQAYRSFSMANGMRTGDIMTGNMFSRKLTEKGFESRHTKTGAWYMGIGLINEGDGIDPSDLIIEP